LNSDNHIDYIRVIDRNEGNVHAFILQAVLSDTDRQDVAVIELEKLQDGKAVLQITGDADVYGIETIIEPTEEVRVNAGATSARAVVNVWAWPSVQYVYGPYYTQWASPWGWAYHPGWWSPWRPIAFHVYSPWWRPYRPYYSLCYSNRIGYQYYRPYRTTSVIVYNHHHHQIDRYRSNHNGRDRYDGRSSNGRDRYEGYSSRSRADYNNHNNHDSGRRYAQNTNTSPNRFRSDDNHRNPQSNTGRSIPERNHERTSSDFRRSSSSDRSQRSAEIQRTPERSPINHQYRQQQPNVTINPGNHRQQQRSSGSHVIERSSGRSSTPSHSGSGNGGRSHDNTRGRH